MLVNFWLALKTAIDGGFKKKNFFLFEICSRIEFMCTG